MTGGGREIWYSIASVQITTASISFIASLVVAVSIWRAGGLSHGPYTRLIFSISTADILQSLAFITGPFAIPASVPEAFWSIGNQATCSASGFLLQFGGSLFAMNSAFLCFYYLCKIKYKMTAARFSAKFERKGHAFIVTTNLIMALAGLGLGSINTSALGHRYCSFAALPTGCRHNAELYGECTEPHTTHAMLVLNIFIVLLLCSLIGIIVCMVSIVWHAIVRDNVFRPFALRSSAATTTDSSQQQGDVLRISDAEVDADNLLRLYLREITAQVLLYVGAFLLCYVPIFMRFQLGDSTFVDFLAATFYPLNGLFTILIYTRPKVGHLRRGHPEYSWISAFILVLKHAGGVENNGGSGPRHQKNLDQIHYSEPCISVPFGVANSSHVVSSGVEFAGSERICTGSFCEYDSSVMCTRSTVDHHGIEGGENLEQESGKCDSGPRHQKNLDQIHYSEPCISVPFGVANISHVASSGVEFAGSERICTGSFCEYDSSVRMCTRSTEDHHSIEGGENLEQESGIMLPTVTQDDDILARAIARTLKMGKK